MLLASILAKVTVPSEGVPIDSFPPHIATTTAPVGGAVVKVRVDPEILKSVPGCCPTPSIKQVQLLLEPGDCERESVVSDASPVIVSTVLLATPPESPERVKKTSITSSSEKVPALTKCVTGNSDATSENILEILGDGAVKTRPFFMNILNPSGGVQDNGITIDRHAIAIYLRDVPSALQVGRASSKNGNTQIQNSYKIASQKLGVHHNDLQATTWLEWRINKAKYVQD